VIRIEQTEPKSSRPVSGMHTSAECRKIAAAKFAEAERLRDERCANRLVLACFDP
jgi:hypothetical protein